MAQPQRELAAPPEDLSSVPHPGSAVHNCDSSSRGSKGSRSCGHLNSCPHSPHADTNTYPQSKIILKINLNQGWQCHGTRSWQRASCWIPDWRKFRVLWYSHVFFHNGETFFRMCHWVMWSFCGHQLVPGHISIVQPTVQRDVVQSNLLYTQNFFLAKCIREVSGHMENT